MADGMLDASELLALSEYIEEGERKAAEGAYPLVKEYAHKVQERWQENAKDTAGRHGKHYSKSITAEQIFAADAAEWEIGPDRAFKQGSMGRGFEFGGSNQPPHLDGQRATIQTEPEFNAATDAFMRTLL